MREAYSVNQLQRLYTVAEDTLDPDDLIFPRAATRVGHKYQANVPLTKDEPIPRSSGSTSVVSERSEGALRSH